MGRVAVAVALGSSVGDRRAHLEFAAARLDEVLDGFRLSRFVETAPVDCAAGAPPFLNAAAVGLTDTPPREFLNTLLAWERVRERQRPYRNAPRTLDLDLVLYGDRVIGEPDLIVPHPRFRERRFVLAPLAEIAPELIDPISRLTIAELLARC